LDHRANYLTLAKGQTAARPMPVQWAHLTFLHPPKSAGLPGVTAAPGLVAATILVAVEGGCQPPGTNRKSNAGALAGPKPPGRMPGFTAGWKPAATPAAGAAARK
jgi:hypothetical protein